jgi:hypothetical protein
MQKHHLSYPCHPWHPWFFRLGLEKGRPPTMSWFTDSNLAKMCWKNALVVCYATGSAGRWFLPIFLPVKS